MTSILRNEYHGEGIDLGNFAENPIVQFERWMEEAIAHNVKEPNALHLATVDASGRPSGRIVLLRDFSERGFSFFTNYSSRKGEDLQQNNNASMTFFWSEIYRQVRLGGKVYRLPAEESDAYFRSRPRESQISAVVSQQSRVLVNRELLEKMANELDEKYRDRPVPRPDDWGGYYLVPDYIEFWQGREHRLHDRLQYITTTPERGWTIRLLYP
ncbi:MAG: pyridoxamine 5'-phosphate oxidase [Bacteroidales bacterium]